MANLDPLTLTMYQWRIQGEGWKRTPPRQDEFFCWLLGAFMQVITEMHNIIPRNNANNVQFTCGTRRCPAVHACLCGAHITTAFICRMCKIHRLPQKHAFACKNCQRFTSTTNLSHGSTGKCCVNNAAE